MAKIVARVDPADHGHTDLPMMGDSGDGRFKYTLNCGHVINRSDRRRWKRVLGRGEQLVQPKTLKCPVCDG